MSEQRPKALVTAAVRGPGLVPARASWPTSPSTRGSTSPRCGSTTPSSWPSGWRPRAPRIVVVESDRCAGPALRAAPGGRVQLPGGSEQRRRGRGHRRRRSGAAGARAATPTPWPSWRWPCSSPPPAGWCRADADVRRGEIYKDGTIPYQRFRAWELAGRTAGLVGLGAVGRALRWRLRGLGLEVIAYDPYADEPTVSLDELLARCRRGLDARTGHPGDDRHDRRQGVRLHARRRGVPQHGQGAAARHRRPGGGAALGQGVGRRARPLRGGVAGRRPSAHHVRLGGARPPHRRGHLRHRVQPHRHHRRGPVPAAGRRPAAPHRQPRSAGPVDRPASKGCSPVVPPSGSCPGSTRTTASSGPAGPTVGSGSCAARSAATFVHPPSPVCPDCLSGDLSPEAVSGRATVVAYTCNVQQWIPGSDPYLIGLVAIDEQESVRLTTNLVDVELEQVRTGMPVEVVFEHHDDVYLPLFRPAATEDRAGMSRPPSPSSAGRSSPASASRRSAGPSAGPTSTSPSRRAWPPSPTPGSPATTSTAWPPIRAWVPAPPDSPGRAVPRCRTPSASGSTGTTAEERGRARCGPSSPPAWRWGPGWPVTCWSTGPCRSRPPREPAGARASAGAAAAAAACPGSPASSSGPCPSARCRRSTGSPWWPSAGCTSSR